MRSAPPAVVVSVLIALAVTQILVALFAHIDWEVSGGMLFLANSSPAA